jgi:alkanesulfonate monooxygenase
MPLQFIGMIRTDNVSEIDGVSASQIERSLDPKFVADFSRAHEEGGFERILIGYHTTSPDGWAVAGHAAANTKRLHVLLAHRPGFVAPPVAARAAVTHDHITNGRFSFNIVTGGSDVDQARDGDWSQKDDRYRRTDEYLTILKKVWTSDEPFDFEGEFYKLAGTYSELKPLQQPSIPIYFGGASAAAVPVGAKHADVYMLWGEPLLAVAGRIAEVRAAAPEGRSPEFSVSLRPIIAPTTEQAWVKAHDYLERIVSHRGGNRVVDQTAAPATGSKRLLEQAAQQEIYDDRLWMPIAAATGAGGNTTALVGTPEEVAESILRYYDLGVTSILIRGFRPYEDVIEYGREIVPLVQAEVARRDAERAKQATEPALAAV